MTVVALIMRPWIMIMRTYGGISCFILADDVLILGAGMKMVSNFAKALDATHQYLHLMGAKVAPDKSYNFASCKKARSWLRTTLWKHIDSGIEVIQDFRYLGAHLTSAKATCSSTLDKRWEKATQQLRKLRYCPATAEAKAKVILAKVYAAALYGVEAAQASPQKIANLTAAVIDAFKSRNNNHNANNFFSTITPTKNDLDPAAQILARRVLQVRRIACKKEGADDRIKSLLRDYATKHKKNGTWPKWYRHENPSEATEDETFPNEQPHPSTKEYEKGWSDQIMPLGPIGLMIESIVWHGI